MSDSEILDELLDSDYEPTEEEVLEYAEWLGMKLPEDNRFLYIAREGLKAPIPEPWKPCKTKDGNIYFFNFETGESTWDHPCDQHYKQRFVEEKNKGAGKKPDNKLPIDVKNKLKPSGLKQDPLLELTQFEKDLKQEKAQFKESCEREMQAKLKEIQREKETQLKQYQAQLDREL